MGISKVEAHSRLLMFEHAKRQRAVKSIFSRDPALQLVWAVMFRAFTALTQGLAQSSAQTTRGSPVATSTSERKVCLPSEALNPT